MRAKDYAVLCMAVEQGIAYGLTRADKYAEDALTEAQRERVADQVEKAVMDSVCEWFAFDCEDHDGE
jgi:hypothetical protein